MRGPRATVIHVERSLQVMPCNFSEVYKEATAALGAATDSGDHTAANAAYREVRKALTELRKSVDRGRSTLALQLQDVDPHVRCWAATHLLPLDEHAASTMLMALTSLPVFIEFNAEMVLREWSADRLKVR